MEGMKMLICPKCGSKDVHTERIMGMDALDKKCSICGYAGLKNDFLPQPKKKKINKKVPQS